MRNTHQFKSGEKAMLEVEIVAIDDKHATVYTGRRPNPFVDVERLRPLPTDGEYRLTMEELQELCADFHHDYGSGAWGEHHDEFVKQWLERKEVRNDN